MKNWLFTLGGLFLGHLALSQNIDFEKEQKKLPKNITPSQLNMAKQSFKRFGDSINAVLAKSGIPRKIGNGVLTSIINGHPIYTSIFNLNAAKTIGTKKAQDDFFLTGSPAIGMRLAVWDEGMVRPNHEQLAGRVTNITTQPLGSHSNHVAGTLIGNGNGNANAKGMAPNALLNVLSFMDTATYWSDLASQSATFPSALISNHSYGDDCGWKLNGASMRYEWYGDKSVSEKIDFKFGWYDIKSKRLDDLCYTFKNHLMVFAAGNDRDNAYVYRSPPLTPYPIWSFPIGSNQLEATPNFWTFGDGFPNGYDCIPSSSGAKNILTVGAVEDIPNGFQSPSDIQVTDFSSWGPTDDGRIKPDIVANGKELLSCDKDNDSDYEILSGTSMASPSVAGSCLLLQQRIKQKTGNFLTAASLKGLVIHTADADNNEYKPNYKIGWGLMNTYKAVQFINDLETTTWLFERQLNNTKFDTITCQSAGSPLMVTICWTDPPCPTVFDQVENKLNNRTPKLVNDLDIRVFNDNDLQYSSTTGYMPYCLSYSSPADDAYRGDNKVDNVEKIYIPNPPVGTYKIVVKHKGVIFNATQPYSILISGANNVLAERVLNIQFQSLQSNYNELSWNDFSSTEINYRIERKASGDAVFSTIGTIPANNLLFRDTAIKPNTLYKYRVYALQQNATQKLSNEVQILTKLAPAVATNLTIQRITIAGVPRTLQLQWLDNANNETGYVIQHSLDGYTFYSLDTVYPVSGTGQYGSKIHANLTENSRNYYRIKTLWNNFSSNFSEIKSYNFSPLPASALNAIEYSFDSDPGPGNATTIQITPASFGINQLFNLPISGLVQGTHQLYIRARATNGYWSNTYSSSFLKLNGLSNSIGLDSIEHFIDNDLGFGLNQRQYVGDITGNDFSIPVVLNTVADGLHTLYVRAKDNKGLWSNIHSGTFINLPGSAGAAAVTRLEYSIDGAKALGQGIAVPIVPATIQDRSFNVDLSTTPPGLHTLHVRAKDNADKWSNIHIGNFLLIDATGGPKAIKKMEYYFDSATSNITSINYAANAAQIIQDLSIPIASLIDGIHFLYVRAYDQNGSISNIFSNSFLKLTGASGERKVIELQYTIDDGLLIGTGTPVTITAANKVDVTFTLPPLTNGKHYISIRAKDNAGMAGNIYVDSVFVNDQAFCALGGNVFYKSTVANASTYQWQGDTGFGWTTISDNGSFSGSNTSTLRMTQPPTFWYGRKYRCVANGIPGLEFILKFSNTWTGAGNSNNWFDPANWSCNGLPDEFVDAVIPGSLSKYPSVNANASCRSLHLKPGATVTVAAGQQINIKGN